MIARGAAEDRCTGALVGQEAAVAKLEETWASVR